MAQTGLIQVARSRRRRLNGVLGAAALRCVLPAERGSTSLLSGCFKITAGCCAAFFAASGSPAAPGCRLQHRQHCGATVPQRRRRGAALPQGRRLVLSALSQKRYCRIIPSQCFIKQLCGFSFPVSVGFFQLVRLSVMHLQNTALLCHYNIFFFIMSLL